ncbi:MAG: hypothetical protein RLZ98_32 [Pseudomonadota bacterium]|jgi:tripartite-type tricarboxylate transporter receptor subunit TctC
MTNRILKPALACTFAAAIAAAPATAEDFYKGKRLTVMINYPAGGPADIDGRIFAKHIGKHIAGTPTVIVQNMGGAGGTIGTKYIAEKGPKDGSLLGILTGAAWRYVNFPEKFKVDFKSYEFVAYQPGTSVYFMRTETKPGIKQPADLMKADGLVAGGLGAENAKDILIRLTLDMLGVKYSYVTGFRGSAGARLALERGEIDFYAESPPSYRSVVEPNLVKTGKALGLFYDPRFVDGKFRVPNQVKGMTLPPFHEFYKQLKGGQMPSGQLWDIYQRILAVNGMLQRMVVFAPGVGRAPIDAMQAAIVKLNTDPEFAKDAEAKVGFVPDYETGPNTNKEVREALTVPAGVTAFIKDYVVKGHSLKAGGK